MSVRISLILEVSEVFLSLHMIFNLERVDVWAILERISGFDPSLEMIASRYLKFSTSSSLWPFILISLWKPFGLFIITFVFVWTDVHFVPCDSCIKTVYQDASFFFLFCIYDNVICKVEVGNKQACRYYSCLVWLWMRVTKSRSSNRGVRGYAPPGIFWNLEALWCNLRLFLNDVCGHISPPHSDILLRVSLIT